MKQLAHINDKPTLSREEVWSRWQPSHLPKTPIIWYRTSRAWHAADQEARIKTIVTPQCARNLRHSFMDGISNLYLLRLSNGAGWRRRRRSRNLSDVGLYSKKNNRAAEQKEDKLLMGNSKAVKELFLNLQASTSSLEVSALFISLAEHTFGTVLVTSWLFATESEELKLFTIKYLQIEYWIFSCKILWETEKSLVKFD